MSTYSRSDFLADVRGYGRVVYAAQRSTLFHSTSAACSVPRLTTADAAAFLDGLHAFVRAERTLTLYRWYEDGPRPRSAPAGTPPSMLGAWWSPRRPGTHIDDLRLPELHKTAREELAIKESWNLMQLVVEAQLRPGAEFFAGRTAPQTENARVLGGGAMQFLVPRSAYAHLRISESHVAR